MTGAAPEDRATASAASGLARSIAFTAGPLIATTAWSLNGDQTTGMRAAIAVAIAIAIGAVVTVLGGGERRRAAGDPVPAAR